MIEETMAAGVLHGRSAEPEEEEEPKKEELKEASGKKRAKGRHEKIVKPADVIPLDDEDLQDF